MKIKYSPDALDSIEDYKFNGKRRDKEKVTALIESIKKNPRNGLGKPERLKYRYPEEHWSRRINQKDRLLYQIISDELVMITAIDGHYEDK